MTKKRVASSLPGRRLVRLGSKLVSSLVVLLCFLALLKLHTYSAPSVSPSPTPRDRAFDNHFRVSQKIAFLFLVRKNLPLDFLWHQFFKNADVSNFSIYIHSKPGFLFDNSTTGSDFFYGRQLRNSIQVVWGDPSMIEAERLLFKAALDDPDNQRFVLLSDSCVPLYNFGYIYNYLLSSPKSFVDSFIDVKESRYNPEMLPTVREDKWLKGSQWITLVRKHAEVIVNDSVVFPVFKKYCKRLSPLNLSNASESSSHLFQHDCIPDEHYVQTLFTIRGLEKEVERRTLTYSFWNSSVEKWNTQSWHPITFNYENAGRQQIDKIREISHVYYESEQRSEQCHTSFSIAPCYLFARKFSRGAAMRLLTEGAVGPYDPRALFDTANLNILPKPRKWMFRSE